MKWYFKLTALLLLLPATLRHWTAAGAAESDFFFPESFPDQDISQYTVRYVSPNGQDTEGCLQSQPYPPPSVGCQSPDSAESAVMPCRSIGYSLLERCAGLDYMITDCTAEITSNLITLFYPGTYGYYDNLSVVLQNYSNLVIGKVPSCKTSQEEVVFSCNRYTDEEGLYNNLYFISAVNLAMDGIVFSRCGPYSPGAAMLNTTNATITNCEFRENLNSGYVSYSSYNTVFQNCTFKNNTCTIAYDEGVTLNPGGYRYAGGLTLLWRNHPQPPVTVLIKNCTFVNNTANISHENLDDFGVRPNFYIPRGHGGAIVASFNETRYHKIIIEDSVITNNVARFNGGGVFISFYQMSYENEIIINRTIIEGNRCTNVGGGISMNTFEIADSNHLIVENSNFTGNVAWAGGGACTINIQDNLVPDERARQSVINNVGVFKNCTFKKNYSPTGGSAVSLVSNARVDQVNAPTVFTDCNFLYNSANNNSDGTVMGFRFPLSFNGTNIFRGNTGGGVSLLQSHLNSHGHIVFEDNVATRGGGMELRDLSVIHLYSGTKMDFVNNSASWGGAISVRSASVGIDTDIIRLFNTRCFLQYEIENTAPHKPPSEWNVKLTFINNTADKYGAAIYATDVERCTYAPSLNVSTSTNSYTRSIFNLDNIFFFERNRVVGVSRTVQDVATAPSWFKVEPQSIEGSPGEILSFSISAVDQGDIWQDAIWSISEEREEESEFGTEYFSLKAGPQEYNHTICAQENRSCVPSNEIKELHFSLVQIIAGSVSNMTRVNYTVRDCHPGYYQVGNRCHLNRTDLTLREDRRNRYFYIRRQFYAAYNVTGSEDIVHAIIPIPFQNCVNNESNLLGCFFKYDNPDEQCSQGRTGFLCGECPPGKGVDLTLIQCADCSVRDTILVAIVVTLFVVGCALILTFNIGIPNELRGCLFFIQVVGFVYQYRVGDERATWDYHLSGVFGSSLYLPLCPIPGTNALYTAAYGMLLPVLAIVTITVYIISAKFIKHLSNKNSFDGIWLLTFIIYKFIADTCFSVLRCQRIVSDQHSETIFRYYYNGNYKCFSTDDLEHLSFAVVALILGVMVILFPAVVLLISFKRFKMTQQLTDVLNKDLKVSCRWWSSFDLFRRLLFILVVLIFNYSVPLYSQVALLFCGLFVFFVFACSKPYNSMKANFIEGFVLLDLLILISLFLDTAEQKRGANRTFGYILLLVPFVFMVLYIAAIIFAYSWKRWCPLSVKSIFSKHKERICNWTQSQRFVPLAHRLVSRESEISIDFSGELVTSGQLETDGDELQSEYFQLREELINSLTG